MEETAGTEAGSASAGTGGASAPAADDPGPVVLPEALLARYRKFSLYNSPYPAHDRACAVDLYPGTAVARSPVAGEVVDARTVRCPDRPYAVDHDHLIVIDTGEHLARVLHVDPAVGAGDEVAVGDPLGELVRSGFFGRWVDNHVHLEFRDRGRNPYRASGSLPLVADVAVEGIPWDGTGTVVETGPTHAVLDAPGRPAGADGDAEPDADPDRNPDLSPDGFAAIAADGGLPLDGGLAHYSGGGIPGHVGETATPAGEERRGAGGRGDSERGDDGRGDSERGDDGRGDGGAVSLLGTRIGTRTGRHVDWADVAVLANGERVTGLSLFAARGAVGAKLVTRPDAGDPTFAVGDEVRVGIVPDDDPVRLG